MIFTIKRLFLTTGVASIPRSLAAGLLAVVIIFPVAVQGKPGASPELKNMRLVGFNDLQGRSTYQPIVHKQNGRYILYAGEHNGRHFNPLTDMDEPNGVSIVDVTNPAHPIYLHHLPANGDAVSPSGRGQSQMVRACSGDDLPNGIPGHHYLLRANGNVGHQIYDVTNPSNPQFVSEPVTGLDGTHKNEWECSTGIAYLIGGVISTTVVPSDPGGYGDWRTDRMMQVFDLSDPANPQFIRNFGLDGQQPGSMVEPVPQDIHGCLSVQDKFPWRAAGGLQAPEGTEGRIYCGYGTRDRGVVQILNREVLLDVSGMTDDERKNPTTDLLNAPVVSQINTPVFMGAHTTFPVLDVDIEEFANDSDNVIKTRDILVIVNEAIAEECGDRSRQQVYLADVTEPVDELGNPEPVQIWPMSNFNVPESDGDFCTIGRRFGSHSPNESFTDVFYKKLVFVAWFNAGVRAIDIRDPFNPKEVAFFIPRTNENTMPANNGEIVIHTNNVEVDDRGFIYIVDRAGTGAHILELTGDARKIAELGK
jgi:hypothetical protein